MYSYSAFRFFLHDISAVFCIERTNRSRKNLQALSHPLLTRIRRSCCKRSFVTVLPEKSYRYEFFRTSPSKYAHEASMTFMYTDEYRFHTVKYGYICRMQTEIFSAGGLKACTRAQHFARHRYLVRARPRIAIIFRKPLPDANQNHQLNWWYALALKGPFACKRLKTRRIDCQPHLYSQAAPKGAFLLPMYSCHP